MHKEIKNQYDSSFKEILDRLSQMEQRLSKLEKGATPGPNMLIATVSPEDLINKVVTAISSSSYRPPIGLPLPSHLRSFWFSATGFSGVELLNK